MTIIDLSVALAHDHPSEPMKPQVVYEDHASTALLMAMMLGCSPDAFPDGQGWASETVTLITHAGTHVDAPYHYFPTSEGRPARRIDELPLDWFVGPGVRLDLRFVERGARIEVADLERALGDHALTGGEIVLLWTGASDAWGSDQYPVSGSGLGRESTLWLVERGVRVIGTDAWGLDRPFDAMRAEYERTGDASVLWEAHRAGIEREYCQVEKLHNLAALPGQTGFTVSCLPVKLERASASWCRAVAFVP